MMSFHAQNFSQYPIKAFKGLLGAMANCLANHGVADVIVGTQLIAFASLLTHGRADLVWPNGLCLPIGANALLVAPSGSGKSLIFRILADPIEGYLSKLSGSQDSNRPNFLIEDATREAIVHSLHEWPVASLFTDEAGQLDGLFKDSATLVKLLDGSPLRNARVSTGRVELIGHRFSMLLMEQPRVFEATKAKMTVGKGGVGLINRFFIAQSTASNLGSSLHQVKLSDSVKYAYEEKAKRLLDATVDNVRAKIHSRPQVYLSPEATQYLTGLESDVSRNRAPDSPWFFIEEHLSRHIERTLRLAGVLHVFENGANGSISVDTIHCAAILSQWYAESFGRMVFEPPKQTQAEVDAIELEQALLQAFYTSGLSQFRQSVMRSCALNLGITPSRFTRALAILGKQRKVRVFMQRTTPWVEINTFFMPLSR